MQPKKKQSTRKHGPDFRRVGLAAILALGLHVILWAVSISYRMYLYLGLPDWLENSIRRGFSVTQIEDLPRFASIVSLLTGVIVVLIVVLSSWLFFGFRQSRGDRRSPQ